MVTVREVAGRADLPGLHRLVGQPGLARLRRAAPRSSTARACTTRVSLDVNPASRQILREPHARRPPGAPRARRRRIHQAGCNGCIGMGQAPATDAISLRTVPRNFPGRSGTREDQVYLCSPETATASALTGVITDPRDLDKEYPRVREPERDRRSTTDILEAPARRGARQVELVRARTSPRCPNSSRCPTPWSWRCC